MTEDFCAGLPAQKGMSGKTLVRLVSASRALSCLLSVVIRGLPFTRVNLPAALGPRPFRYARLWLAFFLSHPDQLIPHIPHLHRIPPVAVRDPHRGEEPRTVVQTLGEIADGIEGPIW